MQSQVQGTHVITETQSSEKLLFPCKGIENPKYIPHENVFRLRWHEWLKIRLESWTFIGSKNAMGLIIQIGTCNGGTALQAGQDLQGILRQFVR